MLKDWLVGNPEMIFVFSALGTALFIFSLLMLLEELIRHKKMRHSHWDIYLLLLVFGAISVFIALWADNDARKLMKGAPIQKETITAPAEPDGLSEKKG